MMESFYFILQYKNNLQQVVASNKVNAIRMMEKVEPGNWMKCYGQFEIEQLIKYGTLKDCLPAEPLYAP